MKAMKKLIPALAMLLVATTVMASASFAWFSMNRTVQATGMQITAKSDSVYLLIGSGDDDTAGEIQAVNTITTAVTVADVDAKVYPSAHDAIANTAAAVATNVSNTYRYMLIGSDPATYITMDQYAALEAEDKALYSADTRPGTNWYYKIADAVTASTSTKEPNYLETLEASYVIHKTVYVTLAAGSNDASNLKVTGMTITAKDGAGTTTIAPIKVLITSATASVELDSTITSSATALAATVTDDDVVAIDIFIYYNGNDDAVYTNNVANLDGANINLTFGVD